MKKIIVVVAVVALVLIAAFLWFRYFGSDDLIGNGNQPPPPGLITSLTPLSENRVAFYWAEGDRIYLVHEDGIVSMIENGAEASVTDQVLPNLGSVMLSPAKSHLLASFGPASQPTFSVFDIEESQWSPLPPGTVAAAWNPTGAQIAYITDTQSGASVSLLAVSDSKKTELIRLAGSDFSLTWVDPKKIYLLEKPSATILVSSWSLDIAKRTLEPLMPPEYGLTAVPDSTGSVMLKFTNAFKENQLSLITVKGDAIAALPFATLPQKCVFHPSRESASGYCAVPKEIPPGILLPDDYFTREVTFSDRFVKWGTDTSEAVVVYESAGGSIDAEQLSVSADAKKIRFVNRYDRKLYDININER